MAISILAVTIKREIAASACSLLAMTRQDSSAMRAPTYLEAVWWLWGRLEEWVFTSCMNDKILLCDPYASPRTLRTSRRDAEVVKSRKGRRVFSLAVPCSRRVIAKERSDCGNLNPGCDNEERDRRVGLQPPRNDASGFARSAGSHKS